MQLDNVGDQTAYYALAFHHPLLLNVEETDVAARDDKLFQA
jgi:hypothetical protein